MDEFYTGLVAGLLAGLVAGILTGFLPAWYFAKKAENSQAKMIQRQEDMIKGQDMVISSLAESIAAQRDINRVLKELADKDSIDGVEKRLVELEQRVKDANKKIVTATLTARYHLAPEVVEKLGLDLGDVLSVQLTRDGKVVEERKSEPRPKE